MAFFLDAGVVAAFGLLLATAAWGDLRVYRIPNALIAAFFLLFILAVGGGLIPRQAIMGHLGAGVFALLAGMALFHWNWIGGGDAKLFAVLALWTGWPEVVRLVTMMALAGGLVSVVVLLRNRGGGQIQGAEREGRLRRRVPYGVAIALAGLDFWIRKLAAPFVFS